MRARGQKHGVAGDARLLASIALALCVGWVTGCTQAASVSATGNPQRVTFTIVGQVTDADGKPMEGVEVWASCGMGTLFRTGRCVSGPDGRYKLSFGPGIRGSIKKGVKYGVLLQAASIFAQKPGYFEANLCRQGNLAMAGEAPPPGRKKWFNSCVLPNEPYELDFVMLPAATIEGRLVDTDGKPMPAAQLHLSGKELPPSSSVLGGAKTRHDGTFTFWNVPLKAWWLQLYLDRRKRPRTQPLEIGSAGVHRVELVYDPTAVTLKIGEVKRSKADGQ